MSKLIEKLAAKIERELGGLSMFFEKLEEKRELRSIRRQLQRGDFNDVRNWPKHLRKEKIKKDKLFAEVKQRLELCGGQLDILYTSLCNREHELTIERIKRITAENELELRKTMDMLDIVETYCIDAYMAEHGWKFRIGYPSIWEKEQE